MLSLAWDPALFLRGGHYCWLSAALPQELSPAPLKPYNPTLDSTRDGRQRDSLWQRLNPQGWEALAVSRSQRQPEPGSPLGGTFQNRKTQIPCSPVSGQVSTAIRRKSGNQIEASRCASGARQPGAGPGAAGPPGPVTQVVTGTEFCILEGLEPEKRQQLFVPKLS